MTIEATGDFLCLVVSGPKKRDDRGKDGGQFG